MLRLLTLLWEGLLALLLRPGMLLFIVLFLVVAVVGYIYWDNVTVAAYIRGFVNKVVPKISVWLAKHTLPLLTKAVAKKWGRLLLVGLLGWWLTDEEKKKVKASRDVALTVAKHYLFHRPKAWWKNDKNQDGKLVLMGLAIAFVVWLITLPFLGIGWIVFVLFFFLDALKALARIVARLVWRVILHLFPKFGAGKFVSFVERIILGIWKMFSDKYGDIQTLHGWHVRREQVKQTVLARANTRRDKAREKIRDWRQARRKRKTTLRSVYVMVALLFVSLAVYPSTLS